MLIHFKKTNAFEQTTEFCIRMKTSFSVVTPSSPKQCCKTLRGCSFVSNIENGERGGYLSQREGAELTNQGKRLVIFMCLNNFCPQLTVHTLCTNPQVWSSPFVRTANTTPADIRQPWATIWALLDFISMAWPMLVLLLCRLKFFSEEISYHKYGWVPCHY